MVNLWLIYGITRNIWLVVTGTWLDYDFPETVGNGMSSSHLTNTIIFQRGRYTTNQQFVMVKTCSTDCTMCLWLFMCNSFAISWSLKVFYVFSSPVVFNHVSFPDAVPLSHSTTILMSHCMFIWLCVKIKALGDHWLNCELSIFSIFHPIIVVSNFDP